MMDHLPKMPDALLREVARDLRPVKPSPLPLRQTLRTAPLALVISSLILLALGARHDSGALGPLLTWGASSAQFLLAIGLVWVATREGTPAGRLPKNIVSAAATAALLAVIALTLVTDAASPASGPLRIAPWIAGLFCGIGSTLAGGILVLLFGVIFRNSLATRPTVAGALYGAGAGVAINAGWRIACPASSAWHTLGSHGIAMIATALLGALIGNLLGRPRIAGRRT